MKKFGRHILVVEFDSDVINEGLMHLIKIKILHAKPSFLHKLDPHSLIYILGWWVHDRIPTRKHETLEWTKSLVVQFLRRPSFVDVLLKPHLVSDLQIWLILAMDINIFLVLSLCLLKFDTSCA
jgi:hypothetical protein